ncbi:bis(5'-nucleosyl)-tetraphosphatase (symmetrical) YqeK [Desulfolucanica intricata]|uniref:bis(5'-nucleosyl)-tetraphosphatase (symmetrical) YqeK n=1 Tax=Desulfolucanica intricata TaxID=1285191 RepID=UPI000B03B09F|nr:bis(5'-nucleosyl)-tetraphosphatase (symmetrical) YqeK [Desulfolucanica intricata]
MPGRGEIFTEREILDKLSGRIKKSRLQHCLGVKDIATEMARSFGADIKKAGLAALLHDCARDWTGADLLKKARLSGIPVTEVDEMLPELLHAPVGALIVKEEFGINDLEIIQAIKYHTTGDCNMSVLDKIIFVADLIEPGRKGNLEEIRKLAFINLDDALLAAFDYTLKYIIRVGSVIHPQTIKARNTILKQKPPFSERNF